MQTITSIEQLDSIYGEVTQPSLDKVLPRISPLYKQWIEASRFLIFTSVGPQGTDASPRGDVDGVVRLVDDQQLWLPDWRGNNRLDSLRNVVLDGRVSLLFMVPGTHNVVRVNGHAQLTADPEVTEKFEQQGKHPRCVVVITVAEIYFQCAKALMRSKLWQPVTKAPAVPSAGQFLEEFQVGFDAQAYDARYPEYAKEKMW